MKLIKWTADKHIIYHAHWLNEAGNWIRLCLTKKGEEPDYAEDIAGQVKCSSCIRRALEMTR